MSIQRPDIVKVINLPVAVVIDDHTLYCEAFASLIERSGFFQSVHTFSAAESLMDFMHRLTEGTEVYLYIDYFLGGNTTALPLINDLRRFYKSLKIIVVSSVANPILISNILTYRIDAFLSKSSGTEEIITCIRRIERKKRYISPYIQEIISRFNHLELIPFSSRELEVLAYFAKGLTVNRTAELMQLSKHTIVSHRRRMMAKTKTRTITELLDYARRLDLI